MGLCEDSDIDAVFRNPGIRRALSDLGIFGIDYGEGRTFASDLWKRCGYSEEEMDDDLFPDLVHPEDRTEVVDQLVSLKAGRADRFERTFRMLRKDGSWIWVRARYAVVTRDAQGKPVFYMGHDQDVTDLKLQEEMLARRLGEFEVLRQVIAEVNASLDLGTTVTAILEHTRRVLPYERASVQLLKGGQLEIIGTIGFEDPAAVQDLKFPFPVPATPATRTIQSRVPVICNDLDRDFPTFRQSSPRTPTRSWLGVPLVASGQVIGLIALDSTVPGFYGERHLELAEVCAGHLAMAIEKASRFEDTRAMALTDALTGAANRHCLRLQGPFFLENARREGSWLSVLMIDLDRFKAVNDGFGHDVGDRVLAAVAQAVRSGLRASCPFFRYGGEEFLVLLPGTGPEEAWAAAERIREAVEALRPAPGEPAATVSLGTASRVPGPRTTLADLIKAADRALYRAKEGGRNRTEAG